jgi:prepilin-type N-terminal cleavage/methylation domain-containing protein
MNFVAANGLSRIINNLKDADEIDHPSHSLDSVRSHTMKRFPKRLEQRTNRTRKAFTLVELLVVIAIIGVLVGLLLPAVFGVRRSFNNAAVKFEVQSLHDAVNQYKNKYGDYPPDGSNWGAFEGHLRKAFPNILQSELNLLNPANGSANSYIRNDYEGRVMDPAEALVFFLGGFSKDGQRPLTGKGGPFVLVGTAYQYNPARENSFYEFKKERLLLGDDELRGNPNDLLPVYSSYQTTAPYVYFNGKTYQSMRPTGLFCNYHRSAPENPVMGVARPLLAASPTPVSLYENRDTFQIISPGVDGLYGWDLQPGSGTPKLFSSTGQGYGLVGAMWAPDSNVNRFRLVATQTEFPMHDNVTNCIDKPTFFDNIDK